MVNIENILNKNIIEQRAKSTGATIILFIKYYLYLDILE